MADADNKPNSKQAEREFSQQQYDMLKRCSDRKDMTEWNNWRCGNLLEEIRLQGANLSGLNLQGARLWAANLQEAKLECAKLQGADLLSANLQGLNLRCAEMQGATLKGAIVNSATSFLYCEIDEDTDFRHVALENTRIEAGIKYLLKYNIRRMNWEEWYPEQKWWLRFVTRKFWEMSDYVISTKRVIQTFFKWAMIFAIIYYALGAFDYYVLGSKNYPGPVANLFVDEVGPISGCLVPLRSIYFSVVTMTTLGFGDLYANPHNRWWGWLGHVLLVFQVILGYVILAALVTRFAVLFTAGGPAGTFSEREPQEQAKRGKGQKPKQQETEGR